MAVEYFEFYRGNMTTGFDYFYGKQTQQGAFILGTPKQMHLEPLDITDEKLIFDKQKPEPSLAKYNGLVRPMAFQWEPLTEHLLDEVRTWNLNYQGNVGSENEEWGLRLKQTESEHELRVWGLNDYPSNFEDVYQWLKTLTTGHL